MKLRTTIYPKSPRVPLLQIMTAWQRANFEPKACRQELESLIQKFQIAPEFFEPSEIERGGCAATSELLVGWHSREHEWIWIINARSGPVVHEIPPDAVSAVADLVRIARASATIAAFRDAASRLGHDAEIIELLCQSADPADRTQSDQRWPSLTHPGMLRREHASLLIRTEQAVVVTDPQGMSSEWTTNYGRYPSDDNPMDAKVLITHTHSDHWDLCSTLWWTPEEVAVLVPRVPAPSILAPDIAAQLRLADQVSEAPQWYSSVRVGDIVIDVLPFYGEQPTRDLCLPHPLRSWGNCYRINLPTWSAMLLVDSGIDAEGSMVDAVSKSINARGPVDVVLSCCYEFTEALNPGLPHYFLTVPFDRLRTYSERKRSITSGPRGLAEICEVAQARWFMPYAHGFSGLGYPPSSTEVPEKQEAGILDALGRALIARGSTTEIVPWSPGDRFEWSRRPSITRWGD